MILGYKTHWPKQMGDLAGKETMFVQKIWKGLLKGGPEMNLKEFSEIGLSLPEKTKGQIDTIMKLDNVSPKLHTIREDPNNRWKPGNKIHQATGVRTKNYFQFAPILECKAVQKIKIEWGWMKPIAGKEKDSGIIGKSYAIVVIDGEYLHPVNVKKLALNDGFESVEHFFRWFNKDFTGKIIHWTDKIY